MIYDDKQYEKDRKVVNRSRDTTEKPKDFSYDQWRNFQQKTFEKAYQMTANDPHRHTDCSRQAWEADMKRNLRTLVDFGPNDKFNEQAFFWNQWAETYVGEKMTRQDGWHKAPGGGSYFDPSNMREKGSAWRETLANYQEKFRATFERVDNYLGEKYGNIWSASKNHSNLER